jgi:hypothetical protein
MEELLLRALTTGQELIPLSDGAPPIAPGRMCKGRRIGRGARARTLLRREVMTLVITFSRRGPSHEGPRFFSNSGSRLSKSTLR